MDLADSLCAHPKRHVLMRTVAVPDEVSLHEEEVVLLAKLFERIDDLRGIRGGCL